MHLVLFFIVFAHILAGALYNKYRLQQLINYIAEARGRELTEDEFGILLRRYTSFLAPYRFSLSRT